jgi:hypothetical protein
MCKPKVTRWSTPFLLLFSRAAATTIAHDTARTRTPADIGGRKYSDHSTFVRSALKCAERRARYVASLHLFGPLHHRTCLSPSSLSPSLTLSNNSLPFGQLSITIAEKHTANKGQGGPEFPVCRAEKTNTHTQKTPLLFFFCLSLSRPIFKRSECCGIAASQNSHPLPRPSFPFLSFLSFLLLFLALFLLLLLWLVSAPPPPQGVVEQILVRRESV